MQCWYWKSEKCFVFLFFLLLSSDPISSKVSEWSAKKVGKKQQHRRTVREDERDTKRKARRRESRKRFRVDVTQIARASAGNRSLFACATWDPGISLQSLVRQIHSQFRELQNSKETSTFPLLSSLKFLEFLVWPVHPEKILSPETLSREPPTHDVHFYWISMDLKHTTSLERSWKMVEWNKNKKNP